MKLCSIAILIGCLVPLHGFSQSRNFRNEFGFRSDNDAYLAIGQDRYYTNGLFITFRHALKMPEEKENKMAKKIWEAEVGQYMYNAQSGYMPDVRYVDRPFAAYLYGAFKYNWYLQDEEIFQVSGSAGMIGPNALGEDAQKLLHKIAGFYDVNGWDYQITNSLEANASFSYIRLLTRTSGNVDFSLHGEADLGTTFSGASVGILFRAGKINPLFNSVATNSRISNSAADAPSEKELFFYTQPLLHFVAYDATLQGGLFNNNKGPVTYRPNRLAFSQELGVKYGGDRWTVGFGLVFQTKEEKAQVHAHQYGSISLFYRFGTH